MADTGVTVELLYQGAEVLYQTTADPADDSHSESAEERQKAIQACELKTNAYIKEVYAYLHQGGTTGDDGDTVQRKILACLIDRGLAPEGTTYEQFLAHLEQNDAKEFGSSASEARQACWIESTQ